MFEILRSKSYRLKKEEEKARKKKIAELPIVDISLEQFMAKTGEKYEAPLDAESGKPTVITGEFFPKRAPQDRELAINAIASGADAVVNRRTRSKSHRRDYFSEAPVYLEEGTPVYLIPNQRGFEQTKGFYDGDEGEE